jgi:hypothetical protein
MHQTNSPNPPVFTKVEEKKRMEKPGNNSPVLGTPKHAMVSWLLDD